MRLTNVATLAQKRCTRFTVLLQATKNSLVQLNFWKRVLRLST
ncbi:Uncharacterised protein [Vibrio cholerae]|nr:Uncharacterised protein [Vibrio cholerae]CSI72264.1 Uncharacterised protein [Vibrio cholerae]